MTSKEAADALVERASEFIDALPPDVVAFLRAAISEAPEQVRLKRAADGRLAVILEFAMVLASEDEADAPPPDTRFGHRVH